MTKLMLNQFMYRVPGQDKPVKLTNDHDKTSVLEMMKHYVQGKLACTSVGELDIWINVEGAQKDVSMNIIIKRSRGMEITAQDVILGGPVVFASHDESGESIPPTEKAKAMLANMRPAGLTNKKNPDKMELIYLIEDFEN